MWIGGSQTRRRIVAGLRTAGLAASLLLMGTAAGRAAPTEPASWVRSVEQAEDRVDGLLEDQQQLKTEIQRLKAETEGRPSDRLQALLRDSLRAEARLEDALDQLRDAQSAAQQALAAQMAETDRAIRSTLTQLESGPLSERRAAARRIQGLRARRQRIERALAQVAPEPAPAWSADWLDVKAEPLDGPQELREKADFVEDARDRLQSQAARVRRKLRHAKEASELRRAARDLASDVALFDEEVRTSRVNQAAPAQAGRDAAPTRPGSPVEESSEPGISAGQDPGRGGLVDDGFLDSGGQGPPTGPGPSVDAPVAASVPRLRDVSPTVLLNLDPTALGDAWSERELRALKQRLKALDRMLARRALELRRRAERLEDAPNGSAAP